jgi:sulfite exporter TauE/SafE
MGMCGPIAIAIPHKSETKLGVVVDDFAYNIGRVITYTVLGALIGIVGATVSLAGYQEILSVIAGVMLLLVILVPKKYANKLTHFSIVGKLVRKLQKHLQFFLQSKNRSSLFILGLLNGLLPCGLVYVALTASLANADILGSALFMTAFGFGTVPIMFVIFFARDMISLDLRQKLLKIVPYGIAIVAILLILRGMSIGIPYISPILPEAVNSAGGSCCH